MNQSAAKELSEELLRHVYALPDGEKIKECIQCGTCSASCPSRKWMDKSPQQIIAALRAGRLDEVLNAKTVWLCVSCYACTVRCPAKIPFTDVMYELKRLEAEKGLSKGSDGAAMANAFADVVDRHGRNVETKLLRKYFLSRRILKVFPQIPLAMKLFFKGRLDTVPKILFPPKIKGLKGLRKMLAAIEENGTK